MKEQKVDAVVCQGNYQHVGLDASFHVSSASSVMLNVPVSLSVNSNKAEVAASVADVAVKAPAPAAVAQKAAQRKPSREPATLWKAEIDGKVWRSLRWSLLNV